MTKLKTQTLKFRITMIIIISMIFITILICGSCFYTFKGLMNKSLMESTSSNLKLLLNNIEYEMNQITDLASWCTVNNQVANYLDNAPNNINSNDSLNTYYRVKEQLLNSSASRYINRLIIANTDNALLQICNETTEGNLLDGNISGQVEYFNELIADNEYRWIGLEKDPFISKKERLIIPIIRKISNDSWVFISVNTRIITDYLDSYYHEESELYFIINDNVYKYGQGEIAKVKTLTMEVKDLKDNYKFKNHGEDYIYATCKSNLKDWAIVQRVSNKNFRIQGQVILFLLMFIVGLLFSLGAVLTIVFNRIISKPINKLNEKIYNISKGDFSYEPTIEGDDEIGNIGKGVNYLAKNITELIENKVQDEKHKKNLELKVLQNQINPHFLYNTLNSIKWMAVIQNTTGIPEMTTSLAVLLKNIAKGTDELVTIEEEINLLNEYITIEKYRYGGGIKVQYNIEDKSLMKCKIIKFTLQPIVENAIFHGIEPKGCEGLIDINVERENNDKIILQVMDNGIGINEEKIKDILKNKQNRSKGSFNNIGVKNVDERIKLTFGEEYGISIESKVNEYTKIKFMIPYIKEI